MAYCLVLVYCSALACRVLACLLLGTGLLFGAGLFDACLLGARLLLGAGLVGTALLDIGLLPGAGLLGASLLLGSTGLLCWPTARYWTPLLWALAYSWAPASLALGYCLVMACRASMLGAGSLHGAHPLLGTCLYCSAWAVCRWPAWCWPARH